MTAPARTAAAFYVIGVDGPWVLSNEGAMTLTQCERAIAWQERGTSPRSDWAVCFWDADAQAMREHNGSRTFELTRGPYTVEAFARFMSTLAPRPVDPDAPPTGLETRFFRAMARKEGAADLAYHDEIFECEIPATGSYHKMIEDGIAAIRAQGFEVLRIIDQSSKRECVI